jgi:hypothetical protein
MATAAQNNPSQRTVVLLRPNEKKRLLKLAREEKVSSSEILRRSLNAYQNGSNDSEERQLKKLFAEMNAALDAALISSRNARAEIAEDLAQMRQRREQRA